MKTIFMMSPEYPYPATQGSKIDIWGHISFFHQAGWKVILVVCGPRTAGAKLPIDIDIHFVHRASHYSWPRTENSEAIAAVQTLIDAHRPDVVWIEYAHLARLVSALSVHGAKLWFRSHNFELPHEIDKVLATPLPVSWRRPRKSFAWLRNFCGRLRHIFATEKLMHRIADRIFFISCRDLQVMSQVYRESVARDWVAPFLECSQIPVKDAKHPLDVVYVGAPTHKPNLVGARTLLDELIPAAEAAMPGAFRFHLVGRRGSEYFSQYASETVIVHDFVEDLTALLAHMDIACLPIKSGWGCKIKMIEALASGLPVVASRQTFRGVPAAQGAYYACQTTRDYVEALKQLQSADTRRRTAQAGKAAYTAWVSEGKNVLRASIESNV